MKTQTEPFTTPQGQTDTAVRPDTVSIESPIAVMAFVSDADSEGVAGRCFSDLGLSGAKVVRGDIETAIETLTSRSWPRILIVDISGVRDPLPHINRLAEFCNPETEVLVIGDRNDIVLYRELKAAGVAEYFYKPLVGSLLSRALADLSSGTKTVQLSRSGKLVFVTGVHGGVGTTTIATNLAWYAAEVRQRGVLLLDLDLYRGDAALQLDSQPTHALYEALEDPRRIDELFLERGVISVTERLGLLAGLEPLSRHASLKEEAVEQLLQKLLGHFRYVIVDLPAGLALAFPNLLHRPSSLLLVSDASIVSVREIGRWREFIGANTPERTVLHVLNKADADGALSEQELLGRIPQPDVIIDWSREVMRASTLGIKAVQECGVIRAGIDALSLKLSGAAAEEDRPLWKRIFG